MPMVVATEQRPLPIHQYTHIHRCEAYYLCYPYTDVCKHCLLGTFSVKKSQAYLLGRIRTQDLCPVPRGSLNATYVLAGTCTLTSTCM